MYRILCLIICLFSCSTCGQNLENPTCGYDSKCVLKWFCRNGQINQYGEGVINFRPRSRNICPHYLQVCCKQQNIKAPDLLPAPRSRCGLRNTRGKVIEVVNGLQGEASFAEFPWMVAIFARDNHSEFIGGGSILAPTVVLTAAHIVCSRKTQNILVRAGEWDMDTNYEPYSHVDSTVREIVCHEEFDNGNGWNDIALLILEAPLTFTHHIMPLCMPRKREHFQVQRCFIAGWGKANFTDTEISSKLLKADLPIVNHAECQEKLHATRLGRHFELHESFICAGGEKDIDACTGDGGSPLFCSFSDLPNRYYQLGIVSWGLGCSEKNVPGVYTSVYYMLDWINKKLKERNIDRHHYVPHYSKAFGDV